MNYPSLSKVESKYKEPVLKRAYSKEEGHTSEQEDFAIEQGLKRLKDIASQDFTLHSIIYDEQAMCRIKGQRPL